MTSLVPREMNFVAGRLKTFEKWEFKEPDICTPHKMAEHGFFFCGGRKEPDLARCFVCLKELEGWEADDDPVDAKYHHKGCPVPAFKRPLSEITTAHFVNMLHDQFNNCMLVRCEQQMNQFADQSAKIRRKVAKTNIKQKRGVK